MRITLPERITGAKDALFVLELECPSATVERRLEVATKGPVEALDLRGTGPGGRYVVPAGLDRLHVPLRVTADGPGQAEVLVRCLEGPESGRSETRTVKLEAAPVAAAGNRSRFAVVALVLLVLVGAGIVYGPRLMGGDKVPNYVGKDEKSATDAAKAAGFEVKLRREDVANAAEDGKVRRQKPGPGVEAPKGAVLELVIGKHSGKLTEVPDLVGADATDAEAALKAAGFQTTITYREVDDPKQVGKVQSMSPEGGKELARGDNVELFVGSARAGLPEPGSPDGPPVVPPPPPPPPPGTTGPDPTIPPDPGTPTPPPPPPPTPAADAVVVPEVKGLSRDEAEMRLIEARLVAEFEPTKTTEAGSIGRVLSQVPGPGERVARLSKVKLTVGERAEPIAPTPRQPTDPTPKIPENPEVEPGPVVPPVTPEPGPPPVVPPVKPPDPTPPPAPLVPGKVPDTIGLWREAAEGLVRRAGYYYQVVLKQTADLEDGRVLGQTPHPGETLAAGGTVTLEVARTPVAAGVTVPDLRGLTYDEACSTLRQISLAANEAAGAGTAEQQGKVVSQTPAAGTDVAKNSWVVVVVARSLAATGPGPSDGLTRPPAVGPGTPTFPPTTPRSATQPIPPVRLPSRDSSPTATVPGVDGQNARAAIDAIVKAGLMPIVEVDRTPGAQPGSVRGQTPAAGSPARLGDLVHLKVAVGAVAGERSVSVPVGTGSDAAQAQRNFAQHGLSVEVVELSVPEHPYAGTGRVVAQYPVSTVPASLGRVVTLWVVR